MSDLTLTKTRLFEGVWEGVLTSRGEANVQPSIDVMYLEKKQPGVEVIENREAGNWLVRVRIAPELISDGVHVFLIRDARTGETLESITMLAGEALGDDIRAETELLRAELDMLKRAFRRHCLETM
jgi:hypothetical protein